MKPISNQPANYTQALCANKCVAPIQNQTNKLQNQVFGLFNQLVKNSSIRLSFLYRQPIEARYWKCPNCEVINRIFKNHCMYCNQPYSIY